MRLGRLPLHYFIAMHCLATYYDTVAHNPSSALTRQVSELNDNLWNSTIFYAPAQRNIAYFQQFTDPHINLMRLPTKDAFKHHLKKAMFKELSHAWATLKVGRFTFELFPTWKPRFFSRFHVSRRAECYYIRSCFAQNDSRASRARITPNLPTTCPHCKQSPETVEHIYTQCKCFADARATHFAHLPNLSLRDLLSDENASIHVQKFLRYFLSSKPTNEDDDDDRSVSY